LAIQNLKNTLLTSPGERMMDPEFGAGIRKYLFEPNRAATYLNIEARIRNQVKKYLPFIGILGIKFGHRADAPEGPMGDVVDRDFLGIKISFTIIPLGGAEILSLP